MFGARADKGKRTGLIAFGVIVWSLATFATGFAHSFTQMMIARVVVGIGEASYATLAPTIIDDVTPPDKKSQTLAIFYLAIPVGSALGYLLGGLIESHLGHQIQLLIAQANHSPFDWAGWRMAFFVAGGPGILLALTCLFIAEPARKLREAKAKLAETFRTLARIPLFRRAVLGYCAYTGAVSAFAYWAPKYLAERYTGDLTNATADYYFGLPTVVAGALGTIIGGRWADAAARRGPPITADTAWDARENKLGTNQLLRVCALGMVIAAPLTAVCFVMPTPLTFFLCAFCAEIGLSLSTSPVNAIGLRAVPPELRASAMAGMIFAIHLFGDLWSPSVLGLLNDLLISSVAMMAVPLVFAWSAYLWWPRAKEAS